MTILNFRFSGQKIESKHHTKYLGAILDEHLSFNDYMNTLKQKLNTANVILAKVAIYKMHHFQALKNNWSVGWHNFFHFFYIFNIFITSPAKNQKKPKKKQKEVAMICFVI